MKELIWLIHKTLVIVIMLCTVAVALVMVAAVIGYGEYKMTTTGDIMWALFYVPHVVFIVWYTRKRAKTNH